MVSTWFFRPSVNQGLESANPGPPTGYGKTKWSPWLFWVCSFFCPPQAKVRRSLHPVAHVRVAYSKGTLFCGFQAVPQGSLFSFWGGLKGQPHPIQCPLGGAIAAETSDWRAVSGDSLHLLCIGPKSTNLLATWPRDTI